MGVVKVRGLEQSRKLWGVMMTACGEPVGVFGPHDTEEAAVAQHRRMAGSGAVYRYEVVPFLVET
jgi:hypothetical protein